MLQMMAQSNNIIDDDDNHIAQDVKPTIFHDFLSKGSCSSSDLLPPAGDARGPISSTSDLGSGNQT